MKREIKFKRYHFSDAECKKLHSLTEWGFILFNGLFESFGSPAFISHALYTIDCQYTGFKDLNGKGKEIYEYDYFESSHGIGVVKMVNGCWKVCLDDYDVLLCEYLRNDPTRETKGNIYKNQ